MNMNTRWLAALTLVSLFLSGVAVGGLAVVVLTGGGPDSPTERLAELRPPAPPTAVRGPGTGVLLRTRAFASEDVVRHLNRELELTPEQQDSISVILDHQRDAAQEILSTLGPRLRATVDSASAQIQDLLSPEQQERFDEGILRDPLSVRGRLR